MGRQFLHSHEADRFCCKLLLRDFGHLALRDEVLQDGQQLRVLTQPTVHLVFFFEFGLVGLEVVLGQNLYRDFLAGESVYSQVDIGGRSGRELLVEKVFGGQQLAPHGSGMEQLLEFLVNLRDH